MTVRALPLRAVTASILYGPVAAGRDRGRIVWNGRVLYAIRFMSGEQLSVWAGEKHAELDGQDWRLVEPAR